MSEFKRIEDWIQRWIRKVASQYETETSPERQATVWGEFGDSHVLPDELKRLLNDEDPEDNRVEGEGEGGDINEEDAPQFFSSWVQNIMKPTLDRLEALEREVIALRKEVEKEKSESESESEGKTKKKPKPKKPTESASKKTTTRASQKPAQPRKSSSSKSSTKRKSPAK